MGDPEPGLEDATRRTYLAQERTLLAWWRSGLAAVAVALGVGRLVPALLEVDPLPFAVLGAAFGLMAVAIFAVAAVRDRAVRRALAEGRYEPIAPTLVWVVTGAFVALCVASVVLILAAES